MSAALESAQFVLGPEVSAFEEEFAAYSGAAKRAAAMRRFTTEDTPTAVNWYKQALGATELRRS